MAANTRHISARYASGLHLFRKNRLVPVCFAFIMAVCTGILSYLAVNRQANAASAPSSSTNVSLSAGDASITVSWHRPISLGGGSLTNYLIEHRALGAGSWTTNNAAPTATSYTISGLTNDHKYQVRIAAKTASGTSPYAPILLAIPHAAPTISHVDPAADVTPGQTITIQGSGFLPKGKTIVQIAAGTFQSLALASDGAVYAWGNNEHGQLGNGTTINSTVSAAVSLTGNSALAPSTPKVTIGSVPATDVTIVDSNTITVKVPAHANGLVDVTVDLGNGDPLYKAVKTNAFRYGPNPATPGSGGAGSTNGGNGQHYRGSRPGGTLANTGDNLTILLFTAGILIAGALTLIIGVRLRKDWQA